MGALISLAIQLFLLVIRLMIIAAVWTVRLTVMLVAAVIGAMSSRRD